MAIDWVAIGVQTGLIAAILAVFLAVFRVVAIRWFKMAFVRFVKSLKQDAAAEGAPEGAASSSPGAFTLGGLPIGEILQLIQDPTIQKLIGKFMNRGSSGGGGGW